MSTFVLVHGSWHGAWVWDGVAPLLRREGHRVETPDLPGRGRDWRRAADVTLEEHVNHIVGVLERQSELVVLVGHSFAGVVISHAAERIPEAIRLLVYLAAFLLNDGETVLDALSTGGSSSDYLVIDERRGLLTVNPEAARTAFYSDCSDEDAARAMARLVPEALAPRLTPARITEERFGRVPRVYLETTRDESLSPHVQRRMYSALPCEGVIPLETGHSPFLSAPHLLAARLLEVGG